MTNSSCLILFKHLTDKSNFVVPVLGIYRSVTDDLQNISANKLNFKIYNLKLNFTNFYRDIAKRAKHVTLSIKQTHIECHTEKSPKQIENISI